MIHVLCEINKNKIVT